MTQRRRCEDRKDGHGDGDEDGCAVEAGRKGGPLILDEARRQFRPHRPRAPQTVADSLAGLIEDERVC
ncbi:hypothetical protein D9M68_186120 [compost metagenome]